MLALKQVNPVVRTMPPLLITLTLARLVRALAPDTTSLKDMNSPEALPTAVRKGGLLIRKFKLNST
jgi:hypothetical protein